jgi:hypothetical protein
VDLQRNVPKHDWEQLPKIGPHKHQRCKRCGMVQIKSRPRHIDGQIRGYLWWPRAGRCNAWGKQQQSEVQISTESGESVEKENQ